MNKNLANHISMLVTTFFSIVFIGLAFVILYVKSNDFDRQFKNDIEENSNLISTSIAEPIYTYNQNALKSITKSFSNTWDETVLALRVSDQNNEELLVVISDNEVNKSFKFLKAQDTYVYKEKIVSYDGNKVGKLEIVFSNAVYKKELKKWMMGLVIYTIVAIAVLFIFFYFLFEKLLSVPLYKLTSEISKLKSNDYSAKVDGKFRYELGEIAQDFNDAISVIRNRDQMIQEYANSLEMMIDQRTKERDEQTLKAINSARLASIGEMSAGIAHEINNPLTVISFHAVKLKKYFEKNAPDSHDEIEKLDKIKSMIGRIQKIIEGVKRFSRDGSKEDMQEFDLDKFIESVKDLTNYKIVSSSIDFKLNLQKSTSVLIGQEIQLSQVLINLLNNAVDAISNMAGDKWIHLDIIEKESRLYFSVTDSGLGIPPELREKIKNPFFTTKEKGKGTGLGLSIAISIIKSHGGELYLVEDCPNTKFEFYLPIIKKE